MQVFCGFYRKSARKNEKYLHISEKSSTFAPDFECRGGGIGRHAGLKILWTVMSVPVRPRPAVHKR